MKNLSHKSLPKPERDVLVKGLNFPISRRQLPIVDLITSTESAIKTNKLTSSDTEQIQLKVLATIAREKIPSSNITEEGNFRNEQGSKHRHPSIQQKEMYRNPQHIRLPHQNNLTAQRP